MGGGVLLTIDRNFPVSRQRLMLSEANTRHLLYVGEWRQEDKWLRDIPGLQIVTVGTYGAVPVAPVTVTLPELSADDPAYIFFTSGTTGTPKGVLGRHKGLSHFLTWQKNTFGIRPDDRCAQLTSLSFDVVLRDIFLPLVSGATLCLPDESSDAASSDILRWLNRESITSLHAVPALAQTWLGDADGVSLRNLRWIFFAGEALTGALVQRWRDTFPESGRIVNFYGPTETTLAKCFNIVSDPPSAGVQDIGKPLPHTQALVLNAHGGLCGVGKPGEIAIRTPFRTAGYTNSPHEQKRRFVKNAFRDDPEDIISFNRGPRPLSRRRCDNFSWTQ